MPCRELTVHLTLPHWWRVSEFKAAKGGRAHSATHTSPLLECIVAVADSGPVSETGLCVANGLVSEEERCEWDDSWLSMSETDLQHRWRSCTGNRDWTQQFAFVAA